MRICNADLWAKILDANPLPADCPGDPSAWPAWWRQADHDARSQMYGAVVVIVAEQWADAIETALSSRPAHAAGLTAPTAGMILAALEVVKAQLGPFAPTDQQIAFALTMLVQTWVFGDAMRVTLEVDALERMTG